jgi:hypothetical protein
MIATKFMSNLRSRVAAVLLVGILPALFLFVWSAASNAAEFYNDWTNSHLSAFPSESGPTNDPDADGVANLAEFAFGTDPAVPGGLGNVILPLPSNSNGVFQVVLFEQAGHRPGVQIDLDASADATHWIRPWWLRSLTNSQPGDPTNSVRELFTTYLADTNGFIVRGVVKLVEAGPESANYYVATNGVDSNPGTLAQPFKTLNAAIAAANPGNLIYLRGGTYMTNTTGTISTSHNGTPANPVRLRAYPGEQPILDFSPTVNGRYGIRLQASWWRISGLEIANAGNSGILITGSSNIIERCVIHNCRDSGLQISSPGGSNLILNCDSYRNFDTVTHGENADGFAAKFAGLGQNNTFRGCRAWENADDGWDMFSSTVGVFFDNCWAFRNGTNSLNDPLYAGDGNGFKLGGADTSANYTPAPHRFVNCVAFHNPHDGFDQNNNTAGQSLDQNTSWDNAHKNYYLDHGIVTAGVHVVRNNVSLLFHNGNTTAAGSILISNTWQTITSPPPATNDFLSLDETYATAPRRDDGGLPETPFLRPVPGGRLVDQGADLAAPFSGAAPDIGAFETPVW